MSLYLRVAAGRGRYLLDAARVVQVLPGPPPGGSGAAPLVDLRAIFAEDAAAAGCYVLYAQAAGGAAALLVDRVDGLLDLADAELLPLPPIGALGRFIDAVSTRLSDSRPMLRLRAEQALALAASVAAPAPAAGADRG